MARVIHTGEFFVVGGPVQPDRPCYIQRDSDEHLLQSLRDQRFCYVLGPRASGKSSLMARTIRVLRAEGQLAAVVDLAQIGARGESAEAGRWYYSIAYRIVRELRLKVDLQSWWQEKSALMSEQRLAEFFWEIVLANTTVPVTVFVDEIEQTIGLPFAQELFSAIRASYTGRATEPDYSRLNFVVLGVATPRQLCKDPSVSPFDEGMPIELNDFTLEETHQLAAGLASSPDQAHGLLETIYAWAKGHPYLTQKIARGVVRRSGRSEDVDLVVNERFLSSGAAQSEPLLNHIRTLLTGGAPHTRQALVLLGKIGKGAEIYSEPGANSQQILRLAGLITVGPQGQLTFRNRVFEEVFTSRWVNSALPFDWRSYAAAIGVIAALVLIPLWYTQYLPRPYINTLAAVTEDYEVALDAHEKLSRYPGFGGTADRLLGEVMVRRSRRAETFAEAQAADATLRRLPGHEGLAAELMGEYWLRRAREAVRAEQRDHALLYTMAALPGQDEAARTLAGELIGDDYRHLTRSFRLPESPAYWGVDWQAGELTLVDQAHRARRLSLENEASVVFPQRLTALQHVPVSRELTVDEPGSAGAFRLSLDVTHPASDELMVTLEAPSGARAGLTLSSDGDGEQGFVARGRSPLAVLADEDRQGVWRLTLVDRGVGASGVLNRWSLSFGADAEAPEDVPEQGVAIPDPVRTDQVGIRVGEASRLAVAYPARAGAVGALAVWDLTEGASPGDLQLDAMLEFVELARGANRVVVVTGNTLTLWDVLEAAPRARVETQTGFLLPPALAADGDYVAIAEGLETGGALYSLVRAEDGELVASVEGLTGVRTWVLGPQARYLALLGPSRLVRIMDPRRGNLIMELPHERDLERIMAAPAGGLLVTVDEVGDIRAWQVVESPDEGPPDRSWRLGVTVDPDSVSLAGDGSMLAFEAPQGHVVARELSGDREPLSFRIDRTDTPVQTRLSPEGRSLITVSDTLLQLWRLDDAGPGARADLELSAMALDEAGDVAVLGFRDGHVRVRSASQLKRPTPGDEPVEYIGHQDAITSLAVNASRGLIVSGGGDGLVRLWDLASGAPTAPFMRHPAGPIRAVALSSDGRWLASAAEYSARVWRVEDGELSGEVPVNGAALTTTFAPDPVLVAVGDSAGNVFLAAPTGSAPLRSFRAQDAVMTLAFAPDGRLLASGDAAGQVQLWDPLTAETVGEPVDFPHPVRWVGFSNEGRFLVAQTNHWLHRLSVAPRGLFVVESRLLEVGLEAGAALAAPRGDQLRLVGGRGLGQPLFHQIDVSEPLSSPLAPDSPLLMRDWTRVLGLRLDATGAVVPVAP